jgi:hypothetical protein
LRDGHISGKLGIGSWGQAVHRFGIVIAVLAALVPATPAAGGMVPKASPDRTVRQFIQRAVETLIAGEFAGRSMPRENVSRARPTCTPEDYESLRAGSGEPARLEAFHRSCKVVELLPFDGTRIHAVSFLPAGSCTILRRAFDDIIKYAVDRANSFGNDHIGFEYKGASYRGRHRGMVQRAQLQASCQADGSLRIVGMKQRR